MKKNKCSVCDKLIWKPAKLCKVCSNKSRAYVNRLGVDYSICVDCGEKCSVSAKRCNKCSPKSRIKSYPKCMDCGKELKTRSAKRCNSCKGKHFVRIGVIDVRKLHTPEANKKQGLSLKRFHENNPNVASKRMKKLWSTKKYRETMYKVMNSDEYKDKLIKGIKRSSNIKPNKAELKLVNILNNLFGDYYKFVGDFSYNVNGFNPDFINIENKRIIEHFGNYWHNLPNYKKRDKIKLNTYKQNGWKCLVVWEKELKNTVKLSNKLLKWHEIKYF